MQISTLAFAKVIPIMPKELAIVVQTCASMSLGIINSVPIMTTSHMHKASRNQQLLICYWNFKCTTFPFPHIHLKWHWITTFLTFVGTRCHHAFQQPTRNPTPADARFDSSGWPPPCYSTILAFLNSGFAIDVAYLMNAWMNVQVPAAGRTERP